MLDQNGYPTDETLKEIENWPYEDLPSLMEFIKSIWRYANWGWEQSGENYYISTGGWSGNEDIIMALKSHRMFWPLCARQWRVGGHYIFRVRQTKFNCDTCEDSTVVQHEDYPGLNCYRNCLDCSSKGVA